ncbi:MAG: ABC transporter permease [Eubacteriales bacterium]|nr:ABC transporter permease [Eubacteriales bacterium]
MKINKKIRNAILQPFLAIFFSLLVGAIVILIAGENPLRIYGIMLKGAFGSQYYLFTTLNRATPIIICGLGAAIAWSSNLMGIGGEGQMITGGFVCAIVAFYLPAPPVVKIIVAVVCAVLAGGLYSALSAWLLEKFEMSLAISTLMLNYVAHFVTMHFVSNRFLNTVGDRKLIQTEQLDKALRIPKIFAGYSLHWGFVVAVILVFVVWWVRKRTVFGYETKMTGYNIHFCNYGGVNGRFIMYAVLFISGAICALAGVGEVLGNQYRYIHNSYVSTSFAWVGLNAALISAYNPIGVLFTSIILAGIQTGGASIARSTSIPIEISQVIQGCVTLFISAKIVIRFAKHRKKGA